MYILGKKYEIGLYNTQDDANAILLGEKWNCSTCAGYDLI